MPKLKLTGSLRQSWRLIKNVEKHAMLSKTNVFFEVDGTKLHSKQRMTLFTEEENCRVNPRVVR